MILRFGGRDNEVNPEHPSNAETGILVIPVGITNGPLSLLQPLNPKYPKVVRVEGRVTGPVNPEHPLNVDSPIIVKAEERVNEVNPLQF